MKIKNMTSKSSIEINDTDILIIEDSEDTKQVSVKEFREYLLTQGINRNTKLLINSMLDNVIKSLNTAKFVVSEFITHKMNVIITDSNTCDVFIALQNTMTEKWLTANEIHALQLPNDEGIATREIIVSITTNDVFTQCTGYTILDASEISDFSPKENLGYIKAHFEDLTKNEMAIVTHNDIVVTLKDTEIVIELPIEDKHTYEFVTDPDLFSNNVSYVQQIG